MQGKNLKLYKQLLLALMAAAFLLPVFAAPLASAAIPKLINFQGKLTKTSDGTNVADGNYSFQFKIYDAPTSGNLLWTETWDGTGGTSQVNVTNGVFSVKLGTYTDLSTVDFTGGSLYLTVNFNSGSGYDGEMLPRKQLVAAAFAFNANNLVGNGRIAITSTSSVSSAASIAFNPDLSTSTPGVLLTSSSNSTGPTLKVTQNGSGYAAILTGGNVGIGSTTANSTLYVQGSGSTNPFVVGSSTGAALLTVAPNGSTTLASLGTGVVRSAAGSLFNGLVGLAGDVSGVLAVGNGGTGTSTAPVSQGQLLADDGTHKYAPATLVAGTNITITTTTPGQITIASSGGSGVTGGQSGFVPFFTSPTSLSTSTILSNGSVAGINATSSTISFNIQGNAGSNDVLNVASSSGTSYLYVTNAGNVGIGTPSPKFKLEVAGTASTTALNVVGAINDATLTASSLVVTDANHNLVVASFPLNNLIANVSTGTAGNIFNISTSTNSLTINLPLATNGITGQLQGSDWLTFNNKLSGSLSANQLVYATGASSTASSANLSWINAPGYLGIGTATPQSYLSVSPSFNIASGSSSSTLALLPQLTSNASISPMSNFYAFQNLPNLNLLNNTTSITNFFNSYSGLTISTGTITNLYGQYLAAPISTGTPTITNKYAIITEAGAGNLGFGSTTPTAAYFAIQAAGSAADILRVASSTGAVALNVTASGNVGIGSTSPVATLGINGTLNVTGSTSLVSLTNALPVRSTAAGSLFNGAINLGSSDVSGLLAVSNGGIGTTTLGSLTSSNSFLTVTGGQSVLIGTSTSLSLSGNVIANVSTGTAGNIFNISTTTNSLTINLPIASGVLTGQLSNTDWLTFNNKVGGAAVAGQVSFYTAATTTGGSANFLWDNTAKTHEINSSTPSSATLLVVASTSAQTLPILQISSTTGASFFQVSASGNVNIATLSPSSIIVGADANKNLVSVSLATGTAGNIFNLSTTTNSIVLNLPLATNGITGQLQGTDWITFNNKLSGSLSANQLIYATGASSTASSANLTWINAAGFLGVGTATPQSFLSVSPSFNIASGSSSSTLAILPTLTSNASISPMTTFYAQQTLPFINLLNNTTTITSIYGHYTGLNLATGTVTNYYGQYIAQPTLGAGTLTNKYALVTESGAGNVGIGTISPNFKLEVAGTASTTALNVVGAINDATLTASSLVVTDANHNLVVASFPLNNVIATVATGSAGNIFNISTSTNSLTINLPTASINNTGQLSSTDWLTFNNKVGGTAAANQVSFYTAATTTSGSSNFLWDNTAKSLIINSSTPAGATLLVVASTSAQTLPILQVSSTTGLSYFSVSSQGTTTVTNFVISALTGTQCLHEIGGIVSGTGSDCGSSGGMSIGGAVTGGNQGSVLFVNSGNLAQDAGFFWDATNHRLGINSTTPNATLVVQGSSTAPTLDVFRAASSSGATLFKVTAAGNVGVGINAPTALMSLQGSAGAITDLFSVASSTGNAILDVTSQGTVLIGTSTMASAFTTGQTALGIVANVNQFAEVNIQNVSTGNAAESGFSATANNGSATSNFMWMGINNSGYATSVPYNIGAANDADILALGNDLYLANGSANKNLFIVTGGVSTTTNTRLTVTGAGNVGIGTTNPSALLALQGSSGSTSNLFSVASSTGAPTLAVLSNSSVVLGTLLPPTGVTVATSAVGSTLSNSTFFFKVVAIDSSLATTTASSEVSINPTPFSISVSWNAVTGANRYAVFFGTSSGNETSYFLTTSSSSLGSTLSMVISTTTVGQLTGTIPSVSNAYAIKLNPNGSSWFNSGNLLIGPNVSPVSTSSQLTVLPGATTITRVSQTNLANGNSTSTEGDTIFVQGRYAYIVEGSGTSSAFQIFDVSNPTSPTLIATSTLANGGTQVGASKDINSISVIGHYAYIAEGGGTIKAFEIFDISNPFAPLRVSQTNLAHPAGDAIYVQGRYAYIAEGGSLTGSFEIFDISNPAAPVRVSQSDKSAFDGEAIYVQGRYAYLVMGGQAGDNGFDIFDVLNPANPVLLSTTTLATGGTTFDSIYVQGRYAYIAEGGTAGPLPGTNQFEIFDVSNPISPTRVSQSNLTYSAPAGGDGGPSIYVQGRYAYIVEGAGATNAFETFDISNPAAPVLVSQNNLANSQQPDSIYVQGRYAYIAEGGGTTNAFEIFDLGGAYVQQLETGGIESGTLSVRNNFSALDGSFAGSLGIGSSLLVNGSGSIVGSASTTNTTANIFSVSTASTTTNILTVLGNSNVGINSATPGSLLSLQGNTGSATNLLNIASSSGASLLNVTASGNVNINTTTSTGILNIGNAITSSGASAVAGIFNVNNLNLSTNSGFEFGDRFINNIGNNASGTYDGLFVRMVDSTAQNNTVRGIEVQAFSGNNTQGINSGVTSFGHTFGVQGITDGLAGGTSQPAGVFAELDHPSNGNALRAYSNTTTSASLAQFYQETSAFTGNGLLMNFGNNSGSFTGKFMDLQVAGASKMSVNSGGKVTAVGGFNGQCLSSGNFGSSTSGSCNMDVAEIYPASQAMAPGDLVAIDSGAGAAATVKKSAQAYDTKLFGVVSTAPGLILGLNNGEVLLGGQSSTYEQTAAASQLPAVALNGRVPVKIVADTAIHAGDFITSSDVPGLAMKAEHSGQVVGQALEDFDPTTNTDPEPTILVFVKAGYQSIGEPLTLNNTMLSGLDLQSGQTGSANILAALTTSSTPLSETTVTRTDRLVAGLDVITTTLTAKSLKVDQILPALGKDITFVLPADGHLEIGSGLTAGLSFDSAGNASFSGTVSADAFVANHFTSPEITSLQGLAANLQNQASSTQANLQDLTAQFNSFASTTQTALAVLQTSSQGATTTPLNLQTLLAAKQGLSFSGPVAFLQGLSTDTISPASNGGVTINGEVYFVERPYFNTDTAGFAIVSQGTAGVDITFDRDYLEQPIVNASISQDATSTAGAQDQFAQSVFNNNLQFIITNKSVHGFTILLNKPAPSNIEFSWLALAVRNAKTFSSIGPSAPLVSSPDVAQNSPIATSSLPSIIPDASATSTAPQSAPQVAGTSTPALAPTNSATTSPSDGSSSTPAAVSPSPDPAPATTSTASDSAPQDPTNP